jgi:hypothetical protein
MHTPLQRTLPLKSKAQGFMLTSICHVRLELCKRALRRVGDRKPRPRVHYSTRVWENDGFIVALVRR